MFEQVAFHIVSEAVHFPKPMLLHLEQHLLKRQTEGYILTSMNYLGDGDFELILQAEKTLSENFTGELEVPLEGIVWEDLKGKLTVAPWQLYTVSKPTSLKEGVCVATYRMAPDYLEHLNVGDKAQMVDLSTGQLLAEARVQLISKMPVRAISKERLHQISLWHGNVHRHADILKELRSAYEVDATLDTPLVLIVLDVAYVAPELKKRPLWQRVREVFNG